MSVTRIRILSRMVITVSRPVAPVYTLASFVVENGQPGIVQTAGTHRRHACPRADQTGPIPTPGSPTTGGLRPAANPSEGRTLALFLLTGPRVYVSFVPRSQDVHRKGKIRAFVSKVPGSPVVFAPAKKQTHAACAGVGFLPRPRLNLPGATRRGPERIRFADALDHRQAQRAPLCDHGDRAYEVGTEAGRYPAMGFHTRGEMGGVWSPPIKLLDGLWFGIGNDWIGPANKFTSGYGHVKMDLPGRNGMTITRTDFVPDGRRSVLVGLTFAAGDSNRNWAHTRGERPSHRRPPSTSKTA